jgi:7-cyano-7-deazaguanine reductase
MAGGRGSGSRGQIAVAFLLALADGRDRLGGIATKTDAVKEPMMSRKEKPYQGLTLLKQNHAEYPDSPDKAKLEVFENRHPGRDYWITFECPEFTSLCPITGQPDFGRITIRYIADKTCIESKSLKLYLFSFRNHPSFHEEVTNRILDDLVKACKPREMTVFGDFNPRGGISIKVEASHRKK